MGFQPDMSIILDNAMDAIVTANAQGAITGWNAEAFRIFGWSRVDIVGHLLTDIIPEAYRQTHAAGFTRYLHTQKHCAHKHQALSRRFETMGLHLTGHEFPIELTVTPVWIGHETSFVAFIRDLTEQKRSEKALSDLTQRLQDTNRQLESLVSLDPLTALMNRRGISSMLSREQKRARRESQYLATVVLDLDNFKDINDSLGHASGDVVLRETAERLKRCLRAGDFAGRIGGDEFLVLLPCTRKAEAEALAERLRLAIAHPPLVVNSNPLSITASAGVLILPPDLSSLEELLVRTHSILRKSKTCGKNRVSTDSDSPQPLDSLEETLRSHTLRAVWHPIISLNHDRIAGYEMLIRGPKGSLEMPEVLFRASREQNLSLLADIESLKQCAKTVAQRKMRGVIHYNILPTTLLSTPVECILDIIASHKIDCACLEISEQQIIGDPDYLAEKTAELKDHGILIALDDVGFGRSPIEALIGLKPDIAKIDQILVKGVAGNPAKREACSRLVSVLQALEVTIVAEGVETAKDSAFLKEIGVPFAQGFYWGTPGTDDRPSQKTSVPAPPPSNHHRPQTGVEIGFTPRKPVRIDAGGSG